MCGEVITRGLVEATRAITPRAGRRRGGEAGNRSRRARNAAAPARRRAPSVAPVARVRPRRRRRRTRHVGRRRRRRSRRARGPVDRSSLCSAVCFHTSAGRRAAAAEGLARRPRPPAPMIPPGETLRERPRQDRSVRGDPKRGDPASAAAAYAAVRTRASRDETEHDVGRVWIARRRELVGVLAGDALGPSVRCAAADRLCICAETRGSKRRGVADDAATAARFRRRFAGPNVAPATAAAPSRSGSRVVAHSRAARRFFSELAPSPRATARGVPSRSGGRTVAPRIFSLVFHPRQTVRRRVAKFVVYVVSRRRRISPRRTRASPDLERAERCTSPTRSSRGFVSPFRWRASRGGARATPSRRREGSRRALAETRGETPRRGGRLGDARATDVRGRPARRIRGVRRIDRSWARRRASRTRRSMGVAGVVGDDVAGAIGGGDDAGAATGRRRSSAASSRSARRARTPLSPRRGPTPRGAYPPRREPPPRGCGRPLGNRGGGVSHRDDAAVGEAGALVDAVVRGRSIHLPRARWRVGATRALHDGGDARRRRRGIPPPPSPRRSRRRRRRRRPPRRRRREPRRRRARRRRRRVRRRRVRRRRGRRLRSGGGDGGGDGHAAVAVATIRDSNSSTRGFRDRPATVEGGARVAGAQCLASVARACSLASDASFIDAAAEDLAATATKPLLTHVCSAVSAEGRRRDGVARRRRGRRADPTGAHERRRRDFKHAFGGGSRRGDGRRVDAGLDAFAALVEACPRARGHRGDPRRFVWLCVLARSRRVASRRRVASPRARRVPARVPPRVSAGVAQGAVRGDARRARRVRGAGGAAAACHFVASCSSVAVADADADIEDAAPRRSRTSCRCSIVATWERQRVRRVWRERNRTCADSRPTLRPNDDSARPSRRCPTRRRRRRCDAARRRRSSLP